MCNKKTKQTTTNTTSLNDWSKQQYTSGVDGIMGVIDDYNTDTPYQPFTGEMVAGLTGNEQRAREYANTNLGATAGVFGDAKNLINKGAAVELNPTDVSYRTYQSGDEAKFMNPYTSNVVDATGAYIDEARDKEIMNNQARATASGAFGGSRHGVADAELMRTAAMDKAGVFADLNYKGFNDSMDRYERESGNLYQAGTFNAGRQDDATKWNADNAYRGAGALTDLARSQQDSWMREVDMMNQLGMSERDIENARLLAERAKYDDKAADEWRRMSLELQTRIGLLGATPMLVNSTGTATTTTSDPMGTLSGLLQGVGALGSFMPVPKG